MLILVGVLVVFGSVLTGYLLEGGNLHVLVQPAELVIIGGGAAGIILISSPTRNLKILYRAVLGIIKQRPYSRDSYLTALQMLYTIFQFSRRMGPAKLESHIENPHQSELFRDSGNTLDDAAVNFICDSFRIVISAGVSGEDVEELMRVDMEVQRSGRQGAVRMLGNVADALPGLGIVAAVLGVVVTMQALGGPAAEIGHKVAAALVGTFLGILLCYGLIGPIGHHMESQSKSRSEFLQVLREATASFFCGATPLVAVEAARRSIPLDLRPSFDAMDKQLRRVKMPSSDQSDAEAVGA